MKYILPFSFVSLVHDSVCAICLEIEIPWGKGYYYYYHNREKQEQSILQVPSPKSFLLRNRCLTCKNKKTNSFNKGIQCLCTLIVSEDMASSSQPPDEHTNNHQILLRVAYDYEYDYKTRKVSVKQGEILNLLQKTNEHWWKVMRPVINKPFFVPAQYVSPVEEDDQSEDNNPIQSNIALQTTSTTTEPESSCSLPSFSYNNNNDSPGKDAMTGGKNSQAKSNDDTAFSKASTKPRNKINRTDSTRASHRDRAQSKLSSSSTKISSSHGKQLKNWSASLEELSKQIVFPGLTSESVADLTAVTRDSSNPSYLCVRDNDSDNSFNRHTRFDSSSDNQPELINKCLTFRNPAFNNNISHHNHEESSSSSPTEHKDTFNHHQKGSSTEILSQTSNKSVVKSMELLENATLKSETGTISKNSKPPAIPTTFPVRMLDEKWGEYLNPECGRYFYYNNQSKLTSWKPPRNSPSKKSDEPLCSSFSDASANASSFERSLENIPDFVCSSLEIATPDKSSCSNSICDNNIITPELKERSSQSKSSESISSSKVQQSEEDEEKEYSTEDLFSINNVCVPEGWETQWDEASHQMCYVNKTTGARWFASTDPEERIYFYEENSNNSSWLLPNASINRSHSSAQKNLSVDSHDESAEVLNSGNLDYSKSTPVKKRHSVGEVTDRNLKTKSLLISSDLKKHGSFIASGSLPRLPTSIWTNGKLNVLHEGLLSRTKITENGKRLRKSWGTVYAVLTESHLSLFKDLKSFVALTKAEVEIELEGALVDWTPEKSSRKNVFQLNTLSDLQMLFQVDDKELAGEWFDKIRYVTEKTDPTLDISMRLRSTESPENLLESSVGERKISSRLNRNKSTKLRITSTSEDSGERSKIKAHLKKFFNRRPPRESLVKKGIYKDESVFGCSLEKLCALEKGLVPKFVEQCIAAIESKPENLKTDGIYRASGNLSQVQKIRLQVDQNNMACLVQEEDVHLLAGCLKLFFRELKEPLIPSELFEKAIQACHTPNKKEKVNRFREIVSSLPKPNRCTLQVLLKHLLKVASLAEFNRMHIPNLAIVFGPTLMCAVESQNMAIDLMQQNLVIEALLLEYDSIFQ